MSARTLGDQTGHVVNVVHSPQNQCQIDYPNFHSGETLNSRSLQTEFIDGEKGGAVGQKGQDNGDEHLS